MSDQDPLIGQQLANYRLERIIGRGGMAQVYLAHDVKLDRKVAIKVIDARHRHKPKYAERFVQEAKALAKWRHENIVQVYYADDQDGLYYFAMEYIDGNDLATILNHQNKKEQLLPTTDVLHIGLAVASALDYAHQQGVIHRDVTPANIMINSEKRVILMDFGLALDTELGSLGQTGGSYHYIAPEQAQNSANATPQSDLYALAVILYEMLTGQRPFNDPSPTVVGLQHINEPPPNPQTINPDLTDETAAILLQALSKDPDDRYPSGQALLKALSSALDADTPPAPAIAHGIDLIGQQIDEYKLLSLLGHGGMARIYLAQDINLDRQVAIKVIDTPYRQAEDYIDRFAKEAKAIAQLEHPHIMRLYRYGNTTGLLYMAMQYVDGGDLRAHLARHQNKDRHIPFPEIVDLIRQIGTALDYAHSKGVVHRDVKPSNIILDSHGHAYLTDFGLALLSDHTTRGEVFGTPHYIAPEQAVSSANATPQSDLYALGVILYEMMTNQVPFDSADPFTTAMMHIDEPPPPPSTKNDTISPAIEQIILRALAKEPNERFPTGQALADALDEALGTTTTTNPTLATPPSPPTIPTGQAAIDTTPNPQPDTEPSADPPPPNP
ncbi:MAG TPA: serine/threonine-protein kinase, partial [Anaerolineae bacterium]|nr:serine/threonine-protein kinase [Anaerolineae bacterium]